MSKPRLPGPKVGVNLAWLLLPFFAACTNRPVQPSETPGAHPHHTNGSAAAGAPTPHPLEPAPTGVPPVGADVLSQGRAWTARFYQGDLASIWANMTDELRGAFGSEENLRGARGQTHAQLGTEVSVLDESVASAQTFQVYTRTATFSKAPEPVNVQWTLTGDGRISGFRIQPAR